MNIRSILLAGTAFLLLAGTAPAMGAPPAPVKIACTPGAWSVVAPDPNDATNSPLPVQYETEHFAFRWIGTLVPTADARNAGQHLEFVWDYFINKLAFPEPHCRDGQKFKVNVFIGADYGLTGGTDAHGHMAVWIGPGAMRDRFGLAHEFTHSLQSALNAYQGSPYAGWLFESHANWMTHQLPEFRNFTHCSELSVNHPHLYLGSTRVRYCNWQLLEFLKDRFGYQVVNDIWGKAPKPDQPGGEQADPLAVLIKNQGWSLQQFNDLLGEWALHNANWDYTNPDGSDQGAVYRRSYGDYEWRADRPLRTSILDPLDLGKRRFAIPDAGAPQRWGYNIVRLHADPGIQQVNATFRGVVQKESAVKTLPGLANEPATIPPPASNWRWGLVAVDADGRSHYSALQRGADGEATLDVRNDDKGLFMVVLAAPDSFQSIAWDQPYHSIYRYPWMVQFSGAMPDGHQAGAPFPTADGHHHPNGGGWVSARAGVAPTAYVGPYARVLDGKVLDNARIEDHAIVAGGVVQDEARISALSIIRADTQVKDQAQVATNFMGIGEFERGITLSGTAQLYGDVEQRGISLSQGAFTSIVDQSVVGDPTRGFNLSKPPQEVTAPVTHRWRP